MRYSTDPKAVLNVLSHPVGRRVLAGAAAALVSRSAAAEVSAAGRVDSVQGQVIAELASRRRSLVPRADVFVGDDVSTAEQSRAGLFLGRDTTVKLGASTRLKIDRFTMNAGGTLILEGGPMLLDKGPDSPGAPVQVRGAFGLITVRGTRIFVGPSNGVIGIFVVHGLISVVSGGSDFALQTGEGVDIVAAGARATAPAVWGAARVRAALASVE